MANTLGATTRTHPPHSPHARPPGWAAFKKRPSLFGPFTLHAVGNVGLHANGRAAAALRHRSCARRDGSSAARCQAGAVACSRRAQRSDGSSRPATTSSGAGAPWWVGAVAGAGAVGLQWCCGHLATALAPHKLAGYASRSRIAHQSHLGASDRRAWKSGHLAQASLRQGKRLAGSNAALRPSRGSRGIGNGPRCSRDKGTY